MEIWHRKLEAEPGNFIRFYCNNGANGNDVLDANGLNVSDRASCSKDMRSIKGVYQAATPV